MSVLELEQSAAEVLAGGRVRRDVATAYLEWLRAYHGDAALAGLLACLPRRTSLVLRSDEAWLAFADVVALGRALEEQCGRGRTRFLRELGRYSAHVTLPGSGADRFRGEAIHDFFHRAARIQNELHDFGTVAWEELDATSGIMSHYADCYSPVWCAGVAGWYEQALTDRHAVPLYVEEVACRCHGQSTCAFEIRWG